MSLEQAILDRLEKRNAQIAQLQSTIQALERAADAEREHARQQLAPLIEENKRLAEQIEIDEKVSRSSREHAEYQIASLTAEVAKLRAEVPLESTMDALKNAVAKLQEVTTDRDRVLNEMAAILAEAKKSGRCNGDPVALIRQGQNDLNWLRSLEREYAESDKLIDRLQRELSAAQEDRNQAEADAKTAQADARRLGDECARLAGKVAELEAQIKVTPDFTSKVMRK